MTQTGEYKGNPTLTLGVESKYPFTFGVHKAHMILENLEAIKAFCAANPKAGQAKGQTAVNSAQGGAR